MLPFHALRGLHDNSVEARVRGVSRESTARPRAWELIFSTPAPLLVTSRPITLTNDWFCLAGSCARRHDGRASDKNKTHFTRVSCRFFAPLPLLTAPTCARSIIYAIIQSLRPGAFYLISPGTDNDTWTKPQLRLQLPLSDASSRWLSASSAALLLAPSSGARLSE